MKSPLSCLSEEDQWLVYDVASAVCQSMPYEVDDDFFDLLHDELMDRVGEAIYYEGGSRDVH